ncbi:unnamed protein product [Malus baccata var. baccata]
MLSRDRVEWKMHGIRREGGGTLQSREVGAQLKLVRFRESTVKPRYFLINLNGHSPCQLQLGALLEAMKRQRPSSNLLPPSLD